MQNSRRERWLVGSLGLGFLSILLLMPAHAFLSTWTGELFGAPLAWKSWKELLLLALLVPAVWLCALRPELFKALWARPYNKLIVGFFGLHIVLALLSPASFEAVTAGLLMNLRFLALFLVAQLLVEARPSWLSRLKQYAPIWLLVTLTVLSMLAVLQVSVIPKDFLASFGYNVDTGIAPYVLVDQNPDALRAFATTRGPNELGAFLLIPLAVALYFVAHRRWLWASGGVLALGQLALIATGSRSAWLGFIAMSVTAAALWLPRARLKKTLAIAAAPAVTGLVLLVVAAINVPALRLAIFHSSPGDAHLFEGSTEQHWQATWAGIQQVAAAPLGQGVGVAGPASYYNANAAPNISENYFVQIGQEVGLLGAVLFVAICWLVGRQLLRQKEFMPRLLLASLVGLSLIGMLLHVWADDLTSLVWWGLAGLYIANSAAPRHTKARA